MVNSTIPAQVGQIVSYIWKSNPCLVIATKDQPHMMNFGNPELDSKGLALSVEPGHDYIVVETNVDFSPYIHIRAGELR